MIHAVVKYAPGMTTRYSRGMANYITSGNGASSPGYLVLMRHGQTAWSLSGQHTGRTDIPLTDEGERQATEGGRRLREAFPSGFDTPDVLVSPLSRARMTAERAGFEHYRTTEDLLEWDYGRAEGRTRDQVSQLLGRQWELWRDGTEALDGISTGEWVAGLPTGRKILVRNGVGETIEEVALRARHLLESVDRRVLSGHDVLLVAHAHVLRIVTSQWLGVDPRQARLLRFDTAHFSVLSYYKNDRVIDRWNL